MSSDRPPSDPPSIERDGSNPKAPGADDQPREEDVDREAILARRRFFVASAVAGAVLGGASCDGGGPFACLKVASDAAAVEGADAEADAEAASADAGADAGAPSATGAGPTRSPRDAGTDAAPDAGPDAGRDAGKDASAPAPCLRAPGTSKPVPQPCLLVLPPKKE